MRTLCFASNNQNKVEEIRTQLGSFFLQGLADIGCLEELPETQNSIEGNAIQKAKYVFDKYRVACFADDTGLEVDYLNGEPGVFSARYAGEQKNSEDNIQLLLKRLGNSETRSAKFRTVIALAEADGIVTFEGIVPGVILKEKRGTAGFGYDPIFQPTGYATTFAEMTLAEKSLISHRAIAVKKLIEFLKEKYS